MSLLLEPEGQLALQLAAEQTDPDSVAAASALRAQVSAEVAAAALTQESLRRRAVAKFGERARTLYFTRDGLEQATRPRVAAWRAARLLDLGITRVVDLGCGVGTDALAFAEAGLEVLAVENDEQTAEFAALNLAPYPLADVVVGDVLDLVDLQSPPTPGTAVFIDPARRDPVGKGGAGRSWEVADLTPPWSFVEQLLGRGQVVVAKLGPGFPDRLLPTDAEVSFVAERADLVEASVWHGPGVSPLRRAVLLDDQGERSLEATGDEVPEGTGLGRFLLEPAAALIRAHVVGSAPGADQWWTPFPGVAYVASDEPGDPELVTTFEVIESFAWSEKALRAWCRDHDIGTLEIKKRGIEVDPAELRRRLKLKGRQQATVVLTPYRDEAGRTSALVLVVRRVRHG